MPKQLNYQLTDDVLTQVEQAIRKDKQAAVRQRATAMRMLHIGQKPREVAALLNVTEQIVYKWYHRFQDDGIEGLANQPKGRPKKKADDAYIAAREETIAHEPRDYGYDFAIWSVDRLRDHLERVTGVDLSSGRLSVILRQNGYVYRRPKHDLKSLQDADAKAAAQAQLNEIKKVQARTLSGNPLGGSLWTKQP